MVRPQVLSVGGALACAAGPLSARARGRGGRARAALLAARAPAARRRLAAPSAGPACRRRTRKQLDRCLHALEAVADELGLRYSRRAPPASDVSPAALKLAGRSRIII
ncbi:Serine palmitoyltransferase [Operophtera brumata]|uniref:Serine palmitoyltransferase n=1 Tax=Operophtera brumata TaxID=104452 RepID=A0A0L7LLT2_OPEBR|nr:Serine palmitoyltransferase [Operophtera brumata]